MIAQCFDIETKCLVKVALMFLKQNILEFPLRKRFQNFNFSSRFGSKINFKMPDFPTGWKFHFFIIFNHNNFMLHPAICLLTPPWDRKGELPIVFWREVFPLYAKNDGMPSIPRISPLLKGKYEWMNECAVSWHLYLQGRLCYKGLSFIYLFF